MELDFEILQCMKNFMTSILLKASISYVALLFMLNQILGRVPRKEKRMSTNHLEDSLSHFLIEDVAVAL